MSLDRTERQRLFLERATTERVGGQAIKWDLVKAVGISNSANIIEGGLMLATANLDNKTRQNVEGLCVLCVLRFPPEDEVYFAVYVRSDIGRLFDRLERMVADAKDQTGPIEYAARNNNVRLYLARDGHIYLRNKEYWESLDDDLLAFGPPVRVDRILFAVHPPMPSPRRSLLAREFVGYLGSLVGPDRIHEVKVWPEGYAVSDAMKRAPAAIPLAEIESAVTALGGYYRGSILAEYHVAMGHLAHKHFVLLTGISGSGKTRLASLYARAVHGITSAEADDPFFLMCPVRPDWTDPAGLLGYYDPISRKYVVPTFLQAVLLALTHRETPVFVCIDEMNLARVEYYFSDVLSSMESGEPLQLHSHSVPVEGSIGEPILSRLPLPENLYIAGTVNVDETTHPFSDKVLDRANVIDMSAVDIDGFVPFLTTRYPQLSAPAEACRGILKDTAAVLAPHGVGFGYRVAEEFIRYYAHAIGIGAASPETLTDALIRQKILPKVRGGERQRRMLDDLSARLKTFPDSSEVVRRMAEDLNDLGSFQYWR